MTKGIFITGTDTNVGKTQVAIHLLNKLKQQGYTTAGLKPVSSGCAKTEQGLRNDDALLLQAAATFKAPYEWVNPFAFELPIAPHIAAQQVNCHLSTKTILDACQPILNSKMDYTDGIDYIMDAIDYIIVEGAGGFLVPLNAEETMADLAMEMNFPIILVVGLRLGCINHSLLTAQVITHYNLKTLGWIGYPLEPEMPYLQENIDTLKQQLDMPFLGLYPDVELQDIVLPNVEKNIEETSINITMSM